VHDIRHDRPVALKLLHADVAAAVGNERFKQEIRLAARLQHPHILGVLDSGETDGRLWFTMPFVEGESLRDRISRDRQLSVDDALRFGREVAEALDYAHRHGVVHRDIKPENIMISGGHALVADFGIARTLQGDAALTGTGVVIGTPAYMSPEQASNDRPADARSDVYSLGCVMYEILAGEAPFSGPTAQVVLSRVLTETPRPLRNVRHSLSPATEAMIFKAMARVPADRFATAEEFRAELDRAANELRSVTPSHTAAVTMPATGVVLPPARTSNRVIWIAAAVGAVVIAAGGTWWALRPAASSGLQRLAVLPFENLGAPEDDYFADGITDEVRGKLAAIPGLHVTARSSAIEYKKTTKKPAEIGRELGVDYLLTGTVRWQNASGAGDVRRVRVSPELIKVSDSTAAWGQPFDTEMRDVFNVQADIASRVAKALDVALGAGARAQLEEKPTTNAAAYDAFLRGEEQSQNLTLTDPAPLRKAIPEYEKSVALDPSFALAWAQLGRAVCSRARTFPTAEDVERCRTSGERAVALAPNRPESRLALGAYHRFILRDLDKALEQYTLGLQAAPTNVDLLSASAGIERSRGRFQEALVHLQLASQLDPRNLTAAQNLARTYHDLHRHSEAQREYERAMDLAPGNLSVLQQRATDFLSQGDLTGARALITAALSRTDAKVLTVRFATYQEMMWVLPDDLRARVVDLQPADFDNDQGMWALKVGNTYRLMGNDAKARSYGEISAAAYADVAKKFPDDPQQQELLGRALALAGKRAEAVQFGERSLALRGTTLDAVNGPYYKYQVARIFIQAGQFDRAIELLEQVLSVPGDLTPAWLRIDPIFAPLRGNPRFDRISK
jgi:serine/threonine-protein kinase